MASLGLGYRFPGGGDIEIGQFAAGFLFTATSAASLGKGAFASWSGRFVVGGGGRREKGVWFGHDEFVLCESVERVERVWNVTAKEEWRIGVGLG